MGNATFKDGDKPRKTMDILTGPSSGYAYYMASKPGHCSKCARHTSRWLVTVKTTGDYLCLECNRKEKQKKEQISVPVYLEQIDAQQITFPKNKHERPVKQKS